MPAGSRQEIRVIRVDDDPQMRDLTESSLERSDHRFTVETAASADEGLAKLSRHPPDCLVSDYDLLDEKPVFEPGQSLAWEAFETDEFAHYDDVLSQRRNRRHDDPGRV
jgi:CheY-like chemotaxis protein